MEIKRNKVKELRAKKNMTQETLAEAVGVRRETIVFLEKNKYTPSLILAKKISEIFNKNIEEVFFFN